MIIKFIVICCDTTRSIYEEEKINIWSNNGFLKAARGFDKPFELQYKINTAESFFNYNLDEFDVNMSTIISFKKVKERLVNST